MEDDSFQESSSSESGSGSGDTYTEVTTQSWFSRLGNAIKGIVLGGLLLVLGFPLIFWNEGRAVATYKALQEGAGIVVSVPADKVNSQNEGKLIHLTGMATTKENLTDPDFGVSAQAIKLERRTQMYQWKENQKSETVKNVGGSTTTRTTYSYEKVWSGSFIKSDNFKKPGHNNPAQMNYPSKQFTARQVTVGGYRLSPGLINQIGGAEALSFDGMPPLPENLWGRAQWEGSTLYIGKDSQSPAIGDIRVDFQVVKPEMVSIIAKQYQNTLVPYQTSSGNSLEMLEDGVKTPEAMFQQAHEENKILTWGLRFIGALVFFAGISLILKPLSVAFDVLPFLGNVAEAGISFVALVLALGLTMVTVAVAWFYYRPLLAVALILGAVALVLGFKKLRSPAPAPQPAR